MLSNYNKIYKIEKIEKFWARFIVFQNLVCIQRYLYCDFNNNNIIGYIFSSLCFRHISSVTMSDVTHVPVSCEPRPQVTPAHLGVTSWPRDILLMSRSSVKHPMAQAISPDSPAPQLPPCHKSHRMLSRHCHAYLTSTEATSSTGAFDGDAGDNCLLDNFTMKDNWQLHR